MKPFLLFSSILFFASLATADTLDFYHVYYNDVKIAEFNAHDLNDSSTTVLINSRDIQQGDQLIIKYYMDFIMPESTQNVYVADQHGNILLKAEKMGRAHAFNVVELLEKSKVLTSNLIPITHQFTDFDELNFINTLLYFKVE